MSDVLAKALSVSDADEQAEFINTLARELWVVCGGKFGRDGRGGFEQQICFLSDRLDKAGIHLIKELAEFIRLREEEMQ